MIRIKNIGFLVFLFSSSSALSAAPEIGSVAVFSNGNAEKLVEVRQDAQIWEDARKRLIKRSVYPFIPKLAFTRFPASTGGYTQTVAKGNPDKLIPFGSDQSLSFKMERRSLDGTSARENFWQCDYQGNGQFLFNDLSLQTVRYECVRYLPNRWRVKERLSIVYSPQLGINVETIRESKGKSKTTRLVALLAPAEASVETVAQLVKEQKK